MEIFEAVEKDDVLAVERLLQTTPNLVRKRKEFAGVPLHVARSGEMVRLLLRHGSDVDASGWMGVAPLHAAAERGDLAAVEALLEGGADPCGRSEGGDTPLHRARTAAVVEALAAAGAADMNVRESAGRTPLHWAAQHGRDEAVQSLLNHEADVDARCDWGQTPLHWAAQEVRVAVLRRLIAAGAAVDPLDVAFGTTPLHGAAFRGQTDAVELLLQAGANPNLRDRSGKTPFHLVQSNKALKARLLQHASSEELGLQASVQHGPLEPLALHRLRVHPLGDGAVGIAQNGRLACWELADAPRVTHWIQTPFSEISDIAIDPRSGTLTLASEAESLEVRRWEDLSLLRRIPLPNPDGATALDYSPDGRFLAVADRSEHVHLLESATGVVRASVDAGEWCGCVRFSPDGGLLAVACSYQGGGALRVHRVEGDGSLTLLYEAVRSNVYTPAADFIDNLVHLAFISDGSGLALFETSEAAYESNPTGWRGNVVMFDAETGAERWKTRIMGTPTGHNEGLAAAELPRGFVSRMAILGQQLICGGTRGVLVVLDVRTGRLISRADLPTTTDVLGFAGDPQQGWLWALTGEGPLTVTDWQFNTAS